MSGRERSLVLVLLLLVAPVGLWFIVASPLLDARESAIARLAEARSLDAWVRARDAEWAARAGATGPSATVAPVGLSGLDRALTEAGLRETATRLENARNGAIAIRLEEAEFALVGPFLEQVERSLGYDIGSLRLLREDEAGLVTAEMELTPEG
jgi:type II secretory pathway component PulM